MRRVLFVDDDPNILSGLKDLLRKQRKVWEMVFALGGPAAIEELKSATFDVVVTDMRMPTIDGATLLAHVKDHYPGCARIVLSGHAEREAVVRALPVAHQFLSKPCDVNLLKAVIERACNLQHRLQDDNVRSIVGKLDRLPAAPRTYWELTQAAGRADVTIGELVEIVEQDPALAIKVLQLVNSAYFGTARQMTSIGQAVSYLGTDLLKSLALQVHAFSTLPVAPIEGFSLERIQQSSLLAARIAKKLASDRERASDAFTAALVHDIGKIVLAVGAPERYAEVLREAHTSQRCVHQVEQEKFGITHADVGGYLLGFWGLPLTIVEAVAFHHTPSIVTEGSVETLGLVHIADAVGEALSDPSAPSADDALDLPFLERTQLIDLLPTWRAMAAELAAGGSAREPGARKHG